MNRADLFFQTHGQRWIKILLVVGLAAIATLTVVPALASGQWPWHQSLQAPGMEQLRTLTDTSLPLPGWQVRSHSQLTINGQTWALSEYTRPSDNDLDQLDQIGVLLRPQTWHDNQPTVEWVDLQGAQNWRMADTTPLKFATDTSTVRARYFQGRTEQQTLAVLQWYAWPQGGDFAPGRWFWRDQRSQWRTQQRTPWVAVCLLLPIQPLGDIQAHAETATQLGQAIQTALMTTTLQRP